MPILDNHHKVNKGMGGSQTKEFHGNREWLSRRDHRGAHGSGRKMRQKKYEAQGALLRDLNKMATSGLIGEAGIRAVMGCTGEKGEPLWRRIRRQLIGGPYWPVKDVARAIMRGKLYTPLI